MPRIRYRNYDDWKLSNADDEYDGGEPMEERDPDADRDDAEDRRMNEEEDASCSK
jgi:hypothetical protein